MARLIAETNIPSTPLSAGVAKTVFQLKAPANQRLAILAFGLYFDGVTSTAVPVQVRILRQSSAGTSLVSATPTAVEPELTETVQATAQTGSLTTQTEPTAGAVLKTLTIPAFMGQYEFLAVNYQEYIVGGGGYIGIECNAPAGVNVRGYVRHEE